MPRRQILGGSTTIRCPVGLQAHVREFIAAMIALTELEGVNEEQPHTWMPLGYNTRECVSAQKTFDLVDGGESDKATLKRYHTLYYEADRRKMNLLKAAEKKLNDAMPEEYRFL